MSVICLFSSQYRYIMGCPTLQVLWPYRLNEFVAFVALRKGA